MSLDFSLYAMRETEVFERNITHNLTGMAREAGIYEVLWRPTKGTKAKDIISVLADGLTLLREDRERFEKFNPENGWGDYDGFVEAVSKILTACKENPDARVGSWG